MPPELRSPLPLRSDEAVLVAGGGGFIGGHVVAELRRRGFRRVRSVDIKPIVDWHQVFDDVENLVLDLRERDACRDVVDGTRYVFNFAADMGGMGFIEHHRADCMISVLINTHLLMASKEAGVERFMFASSACVYAADKQEDSNVTALREEDAYPAMPEDGYGWEKLFSERMCRHFLEDWGLSVRVPRFHNVYGPQGTYDGGREKAPAAICRKVIEATRSGSGEIEIWGDGKQTRSFTYIEDAVEGIFRLMESDFTSPVNIGSSQLVTIDELVAIAEEIGDVRLVRRYDTTAPLGVRGRNSDNTKILEVLGWEPTTPLAVGLRRTYEWIYDEIASRSPDPDRLETATSRESR